MTETTGTDQPLTDLASTDLQARIAALPPARRELLEARLAQLVAARGTTGDRIVAGDRSQAAPLGIAQQREWAVERVRGANNITGAFRVVGDLDVALLGRVLGGVVQRHEVLRSTVELRGGTPVQVVHVDDGPDTSDVPVPVVDLTGIDGPELTEEIRRAYAAEVLRPFPPEDPLRLRLTLLRLAADTHVAIFATDHAASDAWSMSIIVRDVAALYRAYRSGGAAPPAPEVQFGDFARWQRARVDAQRIDAEVQHWLATLQGVPSTQSLPTDRPYPRRPEYAGDVHFSVLSQQDAARIRRFGDEEGASLVMVLLAASAVVLQRHLRQDDLLIGTLASGRTRVETEDLIGCFANPLPLRIRLDHDTTLREVVRAARDSLATALDHQDVPFDKLADALQVGRNAVQTSLTGLWINVLSGPDMTLHLPDLTIGVEPIHLGMASVDLTLVAVPESDRLSLQWHYMTELFDTATVELLAGQFEQALHQIATAPDRTVGEVELDADSGREPAQDRAQHLAPGEASAPGFVTAFETRAALAPHAPAVVCDGGAVGYGELDAAAGALARHLRGLGVDRDVPVAVLVDRSPRLATAVLGVLKAGGAFVTLDPAYPVERLAFVMADAAAHAIVADTDQVERLRAAGVPLPPHVVLADAPLPDVSLSDTGPPLLPPDPDALAYVLYTSGSTGTPKGAGITHGSLATFARDIAERLGLGAGDRFLQFASPAFDVLVEELFPIWLAGGAVVTSTDHIVSGEVDLVELATRERITVMELPTAYWHEWVRELDRLGTRLPDHLRLVIIGGERVLPERLAMWRRHRVALQHVYGLTETTCSSTFFLVDPAAPEQDWPNLPIGTPIPSADLLVLDNRLRPTVRGGVGELYIGGGSLARGYLGRPGLTAQRFVANPSPSWRAGGRLYRTGDLVRRRADGNLEFLSRVDTQVHVRGFRIEPTEVESVLVTQPAVAEAVVGLHEPRPGDRRLVAWLVPAPGATLPAASELRAALERELPPHMLPSTFVELAALPLSANGKVDHARLPAPDGHSPAAASAGSVAPESDTQRSLAAIVGEVVGVVGIGIHDNFFEIGGDSILAIQVVARAQDAGLQLTAYDLFANPTIAALADVVASGVTIDAEQREVAGPIVLSPMQRWFVLSGFAQPQHWNLSVQVELAVPVDPAVLAESVERVLGHDDALRQRFLLAGTRTRARITPSGGVVPLAVHDLAGLDAATRAVRRSEVGAQLQATLDTAVGPLVRVALLRGGEEPDRLLVVAHRLVADHVSLRLLLEDLETAVVQLSEGEELRFLPKTTSWKSWCRRLDAVSRSAELAAQRDYWAAAVAGPSGVLPAVTGPAAVAAGDDTEGGTCTVVTGLDESETTTLLGPAADALSAGVEDVLLAALARALATATGSARTLIDVERHDREKLFDDVDLARTVGWFAVTHPLALVAGDEPPQDTLAAVQAAWRAVPAGGTGWQLLRGGSDPLPDPGVEVLLTWLGTEFHPVTGTFRVLDEPVGHDRNAAAHRPYPVEVVASVHGGRLAIRWHHHPGRHATGTVQQLAEQHLAELRALLATAPEPARFPLAHTDDDQLNALLDRL